MLNVKNAEMADLEQIMKIYRYAQDYMIKSGNPTQWGHFYPDADLIKSDIDKNACKVIYDKDESTGYFRCLMVQNLLISILRAVTG